MRIRDFILNLFFTNRCAACNTLLDVTDPADVCNNCNDELQEHLKNAAIVINNKNIAADKFLFSYHYKKAREMVLHMKYKPDRKICSYFASVAADCIQNDLSFPEFDVITHCPRKPSKKRKVGYDHSQYFARLLAEKLGKPYIELIKRRGGGAEQKKIKSIRDRQKNIENKFYIHNANEIKRKRILMVDDIITSGSTAIECARVLKEAGALKIAALFILD